MADLAYPLSFKDGSLATVSDPADLARQAILSATATLETERVMRPDYGIKTEAFDRLDIGAANYDVRTAIADALSELGRVPHAVRCQMLDGALLVEIAYQAGRDRAQLALTYSDGPINPPDSEPSSPPPTGLIDKLDTDYRRTPVLLVL